MFKHDFLSFVELTLSHFQVQDYGLDLHSWKLRFPIYFKQVILLLFLHNCHGTPEFFDCWNLVGADWVGNLRLDHMEPSVHLRKANTEPSMHFRKGNRKQSMPFTRDHAEFLSRHRIDHVIMWKVKLSKCFI